MPLESFNFLLKFITELGVIKVKMARYYRPEHRPKLVDEDRILFQKIEKVIHEDELASTNYRVISRITNKCKKGEILMAKLEELGHVCKIRKNQYFLAETVQRLAKKVEELANAKGKEKFTMAEFRTVTKLSRGLTIPFLEFFDRSGLTTRFSTGRRIKIRVLLSLVAMTTNLRKRNVSRWGVWTSNPGRVVRPFSVGSTPILFRQNFL